MTRNRRRSAKYLCITLCLSFGRLSTEAHDDDSWQDSSTVACRVGSKRMTCVAALFGVWEKLEDEDVLLPFLLPDEGCVLPSPDQQKMEGRVAAVARRGGCSFGAKALSAQQWGAAALVVMNTNGEAPFPMGAMKSEAALVSIPVVMAPEFLIDHKGKQLIGLHRSQEQELVKQKTSPHSLVAAASAMAAELSREGRHMDSLFQLERAAAASPSLDPILGFQLLWTKQDLAHWENIDAIAKGFHHAVDEAIFGSAASVRAAAPICPRLAPSLGLNDTLAAAVCLAFRDSRDDNRFTKNENRPFHADKARKLRLTYASAFLR